MIGFSVDFLLEYSLNSFILLDVGWYWWIVVSFLVGKNLFLVIEFMILWIWWVFLVLSFVRMILRFFVLVVFNNNFVLVNVCLVLNKKKVSC